MLGFALAVLGYRVSGLNVWQQFKSAPGMENLAPQTPVYCAIVSKPARWAVSCSGCEVSTLPFAWSFELYAHAAGEITPGISSFLLYAPISSPLRSCRGEAFMPGE